MHIVALVFLHFYMIGVFFFFSLWGGWDVYKVEN